MMEVKFPELRWLKQNLIVSEHHKLKTQFHILNNKSNHTHAFFS